MTKTKQQLAAEQLVDLGMRLLGWAADGDALGVAGSRLVAGHKLTKAEIDAAVNQLLTMKQTVKYPSAMTNWDVADCNNLAAELAFLVPMAKPVATTIDSYFWQHVARAILKGNRTTFADQARFTDVEIDWEEVAIQAADLAGYPLRNRDSTTDQPCAMDWYIEQSLRPEFTLANARQTNRVHNWRNYIGDLDKRDWASLPLERRIVLVMEAETEASTEEWD